MLSALDLDSTLPMLAADGSNWFVWKIRMHGFLDVKRLTHHLDDSPPPPTKSRPLADDADEEAVERHGNQNEKYLEWTRADSEARHYIFSAIPDSLLIMTMKHKTSAELWKAICTEHEGKTEALRMAITRRIYNERCTDTDSVSTHIANMVQLREELVVTGGTLDDEMFTAILTSSLPKSYDHVTSTAYEAAEINGRTPTVQQIIAVVKSEHVRRQSRLPRVSTSVALQSNHQKPKKKPVCTNTRCRFRHNHEFKDCASVGGPMYSHHNTPMAENRQGKRNQLPRPETASVWL
jgi:hypothetical protein